MQKRTIKDLHNKQIGHHKFAKVCDILVEQGHKVENIKEFYEKFKFDVDGFWFEYHKNWKASSKEFVDFLLNMLKAKKTIAKELEKQKEKRN